MKKLQMHILRLVKISQLKDAIKQLKSMIKAKIIIKNMVSTSCSPIELKFKIIFPAPKNAMITNEHRNAHAVMENKY